MTCAIKQLQESFPDSTITLVANDPDSYQTTFSVVGSFNTWFRDRLAKRIRWTRIPWLFTASLLALLLYRLTGRSILFFLSEKRRALLGAFFNSDLVVSCPGGYIFGATSGLGLLTTLYTMAFATLAGKPLYLMPQTIEEIRSPWQRALTWWTLNRARVVMAREPITFRWLEQLVLQRPARIEVPDLAYTLETSSHAEAERWLLAHGLDIPSQRPLMGLTIMDWGAQHPSFSEQERYESAITAAARHFIEKHDGAVVFFPQVCDPEPGHDDRAPAHRIAGRLPQLSERVVIIDEPMSYALLKACYGFMDIFVGTRMHSNIFAYLEGVPALAIGYRIKAAGIAQTARMERWHIDIAEVNEQLIIEKLTALWTERDHVRKHLKSVVPPLAEKARTAGSIIASDFQRLMNSTYA